MFEDRNMLRFVYALLGFVSIIIPGPIVPIISFIIAIAMLIYKIKRAKESPEGFEMLMFDIIIIAVVVIVDIGIFAMRISIENEYPSSSQQETKVSDFAENAILAYKISNLSQFSENENHQSEIKRGFTTYLKKELEISDVSVKDNQITCNVGKYTVLFTVTKNDIKYSIKQKEK